MGTRHFIISATVLTASLLTACGGVEPANLAPYERPDGVDGENPTDPVTAPSAMATLLDVTTTTAGTSLTARCMQVVGSSVSSASFPVTLDIANYTGDLDSSGPTVTFRPTQVGEYLVKCRATDGSMADTNGVTVVITAGPAASWTFTAPATDACFGQTDTLSIDGEVFDSFGNTVDGQLSVTIEPNTDVIGSPNTGYRFLADGQYEVTVGVAGSKAADHNITAEVFTVSVDATAPVFELTSPTRGEMVQAGGADDYELAVTGTVTDEATPLVAITFDGKEFDVDGTSQEFTLDTTTMSRWGMSVIAGTAQDACGNIGYVAVPYLRSAEYYPAAVTANASATVTEALSAQVSQSFVDDGDRTDVDDLATIAQSAFDSFDFNTMLVPGQELSRKEFTKDCTGSPFQNWVEVAYIAARHPDPNRNFNLSPYVDSMEFYAGAVGLDAGITDFDFPLQVGVTVVQCAVGIPTIDSFVVNATFGLDRLAVDGIIGADLAPGGQVTASVEAINVDVSGLYLDLDCGTFDSACDSIFQLIAGAAEGMISAKVEEAVVEMVPPVLETGLSGFSIARAIELPAPMAATLNVAATLERLTFCGPYAGAPTPGACHADNSTPGSMGLALGTQFYPAARGAGIPVTARGSIKSNASAPQFSSSSTSFGVGMRTDAINQLFWALWYSGTFEIADLADLSELVPPDAGISMNAELPPVLMPGRNGNLFEIGIAGMQVDVALDAGALLAGPEAEADPTIEVAPFMIEASMTVSMVMGANIEFDNEAGTLRLALDPEPQIYFEIHNLNDLAYAEVLGARMGELIEEMMGEKLKEATAEMELPTFDLSGVAGLPAGTVWGLQNASLSNNDGYLAMSGAVGPVQ